MNLEKVFDRVIEYGFYFLLFSIPLILTPYNYELFEFNKMLLTYGLTIIIVGAWIGRSIIRRKVEIQKTPLDIPIILFLLSQVLSTIFSINRHTSFWGYYSRFHGGLFSTISYILLFYAFVSNIKTKKDSKVLNCIYMLLASAFLVTSYGILEHFGIDADYWVQDVRNRVFSTLGQPNWLGAWINGLILLPIAFILSNSKKVKYDLTTLIPYLIFLIFYFCLLFTGSRSAYFGFLAAFFSFTSLLVFVERKSILNNLHYPASSFFFFIFSFLQEWKKTTLLKTGAVILLITNLSLIQPSLKKEKLKIINLVLLGIIIASLLIGTPISPKLTSILSGRLEKPKPSYETAAPLAQTISDSTEIREVVWKGAIDVWKNWPIFGSGVETFAYSYYNYRPQKHNNLSEWDFLYNKAHNEYLNYLSTTGIVGLGSYALLIIWFFLWGLKKITKLKSNTPNYYLSMAIYSGYLSILVTNFFGFSVVPVALLFWLLPAFMFSLNPSFLKPTTYSFSLIKNKRLRKIKLSKIQFVLLGTILLTTIYLLIVVAKLWYADFKFNQAKKYASNGYLLQAYQNFLTASLLNKQEPLFRIHSGENAATIALTYHQKKESFGMESTGSAELIDQFKQLAVFQTEKALSQNNRHLNYYKTAVKTYLYLGKIEAKYLLEALNLLHKAHQLSPTDPKITLNLAALYQQLGDNDLAIKYLEESVQLKPNYVLAQLSLAKTYHNVGQIQKAIKQLKYLLEMVDNKNKEAKMLLEEWQAGS